MPRRGVLFCLQFISLYFWLWDWERYIWAERGRDWSSGRNVANSKHFCFHEINRLEHNSATERSCWNLCSQKWGSTEAQSGCPQQMLGPHSWGGREAVTLLVLLHPCEGQLWPRQKLIVFMPDQRASSVWGSDSSLWGSLASSNACPIQSLFQLFATPWTAACQASLSITSFQCLLKLMSTESMMPSNHLVLCHPLLLLTSIFPSIRVFSNESVLHIRWQKYWSFGFSVSPSNEYLGLISFRIDWLDLFAVQGTLKSLLQHHSSKASALWHSAFFMIQLSIHAWLLEKP